MTRATPTGRPFPHTYRVKPLETRSSPRGHLRAGSRVWHEVLIVSFLASLVFVVHDVPYVFSHQFWAPDEAWVAVSTRAPLDQVGAVTSSSPTGWTLLLRAVPWGGEQRYRVIPLLFAVAAVVLAYLLGRAVSPTPRWGAIFAAAAALLVPAMLVRNDLKQYTADASVSLLLLWLTARVEAEWSNGRLAALLSAGVACLLISHTTGLVLVLHLFPLPWCRSAAVGGHGCRIWPCQRPPRWPQWP